MLKERTESLLIFICFVSLRLDLSAKSKNPNRKKLIYNNQTLLF